MTPERWRQVEETVHAALSCAESERGPIARACASDEALRREVESLLARQASTDGFLEEPALAAAGLMVSETGGSMLTGRRFGAYEMHARIGAGGMGEVYHARDTKLGRDVAIKILPRLFINNPDRLARFEREARVLASLNHPHIGAIYGVEDATACAPSCSNWSKVRRWPTASPRTHPLMRRWPSRGRSPTRSRRRTRRASCTAISSRPISRSRLTAS